MCLKRSSASLSSLLLIFNRLLKVGNVTSSKLVTIRRCTMIEFRASEVNTRSDAPSAAHTTQIDLVVKHCYS